MRVNVFLFDDFDLLEAFAPAEVFGKMPEHFHIEYYSLKGDFVSAIQGTKVWTDYLDKDLTGDILVIPGGKGARRIIREDNSVGQLLKKTVEQHSYCIMLGSGISLIAQTGALFRRNVCDYPMDKNWNRMFTAAIYRTADARWVADGKYYSASSPVSGIDLCLSLLADIIDLRAAEQIAMEIGYSWNPEEEADIYR